MSVCFFFNFDYSRTSGQARSWRSYWLHFSKAETARAGVPFFFCGIAEFSLFLVIQKETHSNMSIRTADPKLFSRFAHRTVLTIVAFLFLCTVVPTFCAE